MSIIGVIGAGNMASAIVDSSINCGFLTPSEVMTYDVDPDKLSSMKAKGIAGVDSISDLVKTCKYILLSVKPQVVPQVLPEIGSHMSDDSVVISIAAGISAQFIRDGLGKTDAKIILVMPNTPIMVGEGAAAYCCTSNVNYEEKTFGKGLFGASGTVEEISSDRMNEVIAVHGSTPAYIYLITKYFCEYAAAHGIPMDVANRLFCQTLIGSAKMMTETGQSHDQLIEMVTSPGGTTLSGLNSLKDSDLCKTIHDCCDATVKRAYELGAK
ncbi:MAG: pyrroline-5-carboxylate reductase [Angelakisella sp.]